MKPILQRSFHCVLSVLFAVATVAIFSSCRTNGTEASDQKQDLAEQKVREGNSHLAALEEAEKSLRVVGFTLDLDPMLIEMNYPVVFVQILEESKVAAAEPLVKKYIEHAHAALALANSREVQLSGHEKITERLKVAKLYKIAIDKRSKAQPVVNPS